MLYFDNRDDPIHEKRGSQILYWLDDLGAEPIQSVAEGAEGFLFAGARSIEDYAQLIARHPQLRDRPEERVTLLRLDKVLHCIESAGLPLPRPRTWILQVDQALPRDLQYPLFVRTAETSWKRGGFISRVTNERELVAEMEQLRRAFGWDQVILARTWIDLCPAGEGRHGPVPQEVRVWIVDGMPVAWSFHHLHLVAEPVGFPPSDLKQLWHWCESLGSQFHSRLVVADFAKTVRGEWVFIEAGAGSCAGTGHEAVFKAVASRLAGQKTRIFESAVGGLC
jgi:hypothetical protein